jgi:hypothetical protein
MTVSQSIQVIQDHQDHRASQVSSSINSSQPQENIDMAEHSFFYKTNNDFQIYHIICKEISFEIISHLLSNNDYLTQNNVQLNNTHVFYFQQPYDKKIYKVTCEVARYNYIIWMLNKINYGIELNFSGQQQETFSREHKKNLEIHLKHDLISYLAPNNTFQQHTIGNNIVNQSLDYSQGYTNANV